MQLFYDPDLTVGRHELRDTEAAHVARVLRRKVGESIDLVDGKGGWYRGNITDISKRACTLEVDQLRQETHRSAHTLTLLVAPTKNIDRFEWILEKATEIGIDRIQPFFSEHSERTRLRADRLERVVEAAMKQSLRAWLPQLLDPCSFTEAVESAATGDKFLAYLGERNSPLLHQIVRPRVDVSLAIGPEGGFSPAEASLALRHGFHYTSLGPHRLRTETAAIAAVHTVELLNWSSEHNPNGG
ncbi:16S rRNA (uracil1498-N3)-methyltransferase [Lewinella aquimaris]|uniref:Ribosomal RNA small subunit methyltransferase E n=1 Tax=Neolewinella aquimaris TaxID=1835722 RepID=A0A840E2M8_9BACT|nr:RsmE family RNA methyltransferase [Neolewinella aquimaris]MBB4078213.1 16S rRNA (uracil1498-N3)-methyltransferase [Neolewinella aquimaris]